MIGAKQASEMSGLRLSLGLEASFLQCLTRKAGLTLSCGTRPVRRKDYPSIHNYSIYRNRMVYSPPQLDSPVRIRSSSPEFESSRLLKS
jgi:hypothetical protein